MTIEQLTAGRHASAAIHHLHAMQCHREASRHYQAGLDYPRAAQQAFMAHGHTVEALDYCRQALAEHGGYPATPAFANAGRRGVDPWTKYMNHLLARPLDNAVVVATNLSGAEHHAAAAGHAEQAALHNGRASRHCDEGEFPFAAFESQLAHGHALHSFFHGNEAARRYVEHFNWPGPAADLTQQI